MAALLSIYGIATDGTIHSFRFKWNYWQILWYYLWSNRFMCAIKSTYRPVCIQTAITKVIEKILMLIIEGIYFFKIVIIIISVVYSIITTPISRDFNLVNKRKPTFYSLLTFPNCFKWYIFCFRRTKQNGLTHQTTPHEKLF